jgi:hypothetical protein
MTEISEGKLTLVFNNTNWKVEKYDDCDTFKNCIGRTESLKAVDIVGIHNEDTVYFFEMKDYNGYEETKLSNWDYNINSLTKDLSQKVKDTILGVFSTQRNESISNEYWDLIISNFKENNEIKIIFWIDGRLGDYSSSFRLTQLTQNLKRKLRCLNSNILVTNSEMANVIDTIHAYE